MSLIKIVKSIGGKKNYGIEFSDKPNNNTVVRFLDSKSNQVVGFANMSDQTEKKTIDIDTNKLDVEPMFPISNEGLGIIISGEQGSGKSTIGALFVQQYEKMYPSNALLLISQKDKSVDQNLRNISRLTQLNDEMINDFQIDAFSNSLFLIDDSDFGTNYKAVMSLLNLISTVGREYNISWIFITHFNSRLNQTLAYKEAKAYITYNDNLNNNRMLVCHMGLNRNAIERLIKMNASFYIFNKIWNILITDRQIVKLTSIR
jgi:hypothetical protein